METEQYKDINMESENYPSPKKSYILGDDTVTDTEKLKKKSNKNITTDIS